MRHILKWSGLAAVGMLTAAAMLGGNVRPALADCGAQSGQCANGSSYHPSSRYSQQYGDSYDSRGPGGSDGCWADGRRNERSGFDNGYGDNGRHRQRGYYASWNQRHGWRSQRGQGHRWDGRDYGQGGQYRQPGQNDPNDRDDDRGYGNDQGQRGR